MKNIKRIKKKIKNNIKNKMKKRSAGLIVLVLCLLSVRTGYGTEFGGFDIEVGIGEHGGGFPAEPEPVPGSEAPWQEPSCEEIPGAEPERPYFGEPDGGYREESPLYEALEPDTGGGFYGAGHPYGSRNFYGNGNLGGSESLGGDSAAYGTEGQWNTGTGEELRSGTETAEEAEQTPAPTVTPPPTPALTPAPTASPTPVPVSVPPELSVKKAKKKKNADRKNIKFIHPETVEDGACPEIELRTEEDIQLLSVRFNGRECPRRREGKLLVVDREAVSGQGTVEVLAVTEDGTVLEMEPWCW